MARPLTYPGRVPDSSGVLVDDAYVPLRPVRGAGAGEWRAGGETLRDLLRRLGRAPIEDRHPVVCVGSNAAPAQLRRKFGRAVVPMTRADVAGVVPGVSAHVSRWGYLPAAPVRAPGETSRLFVLWLDDRELAALDLTEPNYRRRRLPPGSVTLGGVRLPHCSVYVGRHGCLVDATGRVRRPAEQRTLIGDVLAESPKLRRLCGSTPEAFVERVRDETVREAVRRLFRAEGRTQSWRV